MRALIGLTLLASGLLLNLAGLSFGWAVIPGVIGIALLPGAWQTKPDNSTPTINVRIRGRVRMKPWWMP